MDINHMFVDDLVKVYLAEVENVPPLTRDEEIGCIQHIRGRDPQAEASGQRLAEANLYLVVSIAERYWKNNFYILDLIQHGNDGLLEALRTFAGSSEDSFSTHAAPYIEHAIAKAIASPGGPASIKYYPG
jgi:DNA-directed RNA polymerase sigma subunit (sigma70/sigma32)